MEINKNVTHRKYIQLYTLFSCFYKKKNEEFNDDFCRKTNEFRERKKDGK